jgi:hypothetical protein
MIESMFKDEVFGTKWHCVVTYGDQTHIILWCLMIFGPLSPQSDFNCRWWYSGTHFYFADESDVTTFVLRWT